MLRQPGRSCLKGVQGSFRPCHELTRFNPALWSELWHASSGGGAGIPRFKPMCPMCSRDARFERHLSNLARRGCSQSLEVVLQANRENTRGVTILRSDVPTVIDVLLYANKLGPCSMNTHVLSKSISNICTY